MVPGKAHPARAIEHAAVLAASSACGSAIVTIFGQSNSVEVGVGLTSTVMLLYGSTASMGEGMVQTVREG